MFSGQAYQGGLRASAEHTTRSGGVRARARCEGHDGDLRPEDTLVQGRMLEFEGPGHHLLHLGSCSPRRLHFVWMLENLSPTGNVHHQGSEVVGNDMSRGSLWLQVQQFGIGVGERYSGGTREL